LRDIPSKDVKSDVIKMILLDKTPEGFFKANTPESLPPGSPIFGITFLLLEVDII
jgi:hypothetical protein